MKNFQLFTFLLFVLVTFAVSCSGVGSLGTRSVRDNYVGQHRDEPLMQQWNQSYREALDRQVVVRIPYGENGKFVPTRTDARSYSMTLKAGERVSVRIDAGVAVLSELRNFDGTMALASADTLGSLDFAIAKSGIYKLIVQQGFNASGNFALQITKGPSYGFPVAGKGNAAIGSFWADERDGGKRLHEGIDIFAKRGTPVVAVTDGHVTFTGERGLGGKQVWQRTGLFGNSIYYAHLDRIAVSGGRVRAGDTIGYVGNTGNAKHTAPHLHFGIYTSGGAIDPLPFVYKTRQPKLDMKPAAAARMRVRTAKANIRIGPDDTAAVALQALKNEDLAVLGRSDDWFHVRTADGTRGFVHRSVVGLN